MVTRGTISQLLTFATQKVCNSSIENVRFRFGINLAKFSIDGHLLIAVANGDSVIPSSTMIHCYRVSIKKRLDALTLTSQTLPSFFLSGGAGRDIRDLKITRLQWMDNEDSDSLLVGTKTHTGCFIELWVMVEKATPIHSHFKHLFQQPNKTEVFKTVVSAIFGKRLLKLIEKSCFKTGVDSSSELSLYQSHR